MFGGLPVLDRGSNWHVIWTLGEDMIAGEEDSCTTCVTMGWLVREEPLSVFTHGRMVSDATCDARHQYYRYFGSINEEVAIWFVSDAWHETFLFSDVRPAIVVPYIHGLTLEPSTMCPCCLGSH
jgi:hypothetical protein